MMNAANRVLTTVEIAALLAQHDATALIDKAGASVCMAALKMLGGTYGRRVCVVVGSGNNGKIGRSCATQLSSRGVAVKTIEYNKASSRNIITDGFNLVIDAVLGSTPKRPLNMGQQPKCQVLALDIASGVDPNTGAVMAGANVWFANATVTFIASKPGHHISRGAQYCGELSICDIGVAIEDSIETQRVHIVTPEMALSKNPLRRGDAHKWNSAVGIIAGSPTMTGAGHLAALGALKSGAGMVHLCTPGDTIPQGPIESIKIALPVNHWFSAAIEATERCHICVVGPGLGRSKATLSSMRNFILRAPQPIVIDGDAFFALVGDGEDTGSANPLEVPALPNSGLRAVQQAAARRQGVAMTNVRTFDRNMSPSSALATRREGSTVLTPHDGEYEQLTGVKVGNNRIAAARDLAKLSASVVALKGPTTVVADPSGRVELIVNGDERLATAGTGDVLAGTIASLMAQGASAFDAATLGAYVNAQSAALGPRIGLNASDVAANLAQVLSELATS